MCDDKRREEIAIKVDTIQTSFTGGEFAAALFGRTDIAQYANACAIVENFLIRPYGPAISRPGLEYINEAKTGGSTSISRLIKFIFSRTDAYVIEMGVGYFRFYTNGAVVCSTGTTPYEVAHTYTAAELFDVQFCQLNDVIYLSHASHAPAKLIRYAATSWSLSTLAFTGGPFMPDNTGATTISATATAGNVTISASSSIFTPSGSTLGHKNTFWKMGATRTNSTTGLAEQGFFQITAVTNPSTATATVIKTLTTSAATTSWAEGSWSDVRGWPARVTFHQQRLFFARTNTEPQTIWGSKSFIYDSFAVDGGSEDDAINIQLASNEANEIKWLVPGTSLVAGTYGGEFVIKSGDDSPLTPANTNVHKQTSWGSEAIVPVKIGNYFYYVQRFAKKIRELFYFWDTDSYKSVDKTILSPHIAGGGFKDIAYQQNPDTILYCVCSNGTIATMTREIDQEVAAWTRHTTDGNFESITSIPSQAGSYDEVWAVVNRTVGGSTHRYIERFKSPEVPDRQDQCFYVDAGLTYDAYAATSTATVNMSLSATSGTIVITTSTSYFTAGSVTRRIRAINSAGTTLGELLITGYTSGTVVIGTVKFNFTAQSYTGGSWGVSVKTISGLGHLEAKTVSVLADGGTDKPNKVVSNGTITLAYDYFYVVAGLPYTQKLKSLPQEAGSGRGTAQGKVQRINQVGFKVNRSHKGFYVGGNESETDLVNYAESSTSQIIFTGAIPNTDFVLYRTSYRDPTTLLGTSESLFTGIIPNISFRGNYEYGAQVYLENSDPLPLELLSIMTTLSTEDK